MPMEIEMAQKKTRAILYTALLTGAVVLAGCGGGEERQVKYLEKAKEYYNAENMEKARIEVKNVLQINPNNAEARYYLALISEKDKDFRAAYGNLSAVLESNPQHLLALNKVTEYLIAAKELDRAKEKAEAALTVDPKSADALANMAMIYAQQKDDDSATMKAQEALAVEPGNVKAVAVLSTIYAKDNPNLALETITEGINNQSENESLKMLKIRLLNSQHKREEAETLYQELIREHPEKDIYTLMLVNFHLGDDSVPEAQRKDTAEQLLRDLMGKKPEAEEPKKWLVEFLFKNRGQESAKNELKKLVSADASTSVFRDMLASIYLSEQDFSEAKKLYLPIVDSDPIGAHGIEARNRLVDIALKQRDMEAVERLQKEILELEPENESALLTAAKLKIAGGDVEGAIPDLRVVLKNNPQSKQALFLLGEAHLKNNAPELALDNYQQLLAIEPKHLQALIRSAKILANQNQVDKALELAERAMSIDASNVDAAVLITELYASKERWDDALEAARKLMADDKTKALGYYLEGRVYLKQKQFGKAVKSLSSSIELQPAGIETLSSLVAAYIGKNGNTDKAYEYVLAHSKKYPEQLHAKQLLVGLYDRRGESAKAVELGKSIIDQNPDQPTGYLLVGRSYALAGNKQKTEESYLAGIKANPENPTLKMALAEFYQQSGEMDKAIEHYEQLLKAKPNNQVAKNNLASLLADHSNTPEGLKRAEELTADFGNAGVPAFLDTAGWVQYRLGNYAQAVSLLGAAVQGGAEGAIYHYHLGMAYFKSDLKAQAKEQLRLALKDDTADFAGKDEAREVLNSL